MVISFGLTEEWCVEVKKVGFNCGNLMIDGRQIRELETVLNADRIDFLGDIDPKVPIKTILNMDYRVITPKDIDDLYLAG